MRAAAFVAALSELPMVPAAVSVQRLAEVMREASAQPAAKLGQGPAFRVRRVWPRERRRAGQVAPALPPGAAVPLQAVLRQEAASVAPVQPWEAERREGPEDGEEQQSAGAAVPPLGVALAAAAQRLAVQPAVVRASEVPRRVEEERLPEAQGAEERLPEVQHRGAAQDETVPRLERPEAGPSAAAGPPFGPRALPPAEPLARRPQIQSRSAHVRQARRGVRVSALKWPAARNECLTWYLWSSKNSDDKTRDGETASPAEQFGAMINCYRLGWIVAAGKNNIVIYFRTYSDLPSRHSPRVQIAIIECRSLSD